MDIQRREFLKGLCGFGAVAAVSRLPAAAGDPALFPRRGWWERLSIVAHHLHIGAEKPFSLLHISDTHLTAAYPDDCQWARSQASRRSATFGGRQEEALCRSWIC